MFGKMCAIDVLHTESWQVCPVYTTLLDTKHACAPRRRKFTQPVNSVLTPNYHTFQGVYYMPSFLLDHIVLDEGVAYFGRRMVCVVKCILSEEANNQKRMTKINVIRDRRPG